MREGRTGRTFYEECVTQWMRCAGICPTVITTEIRASERNLRAASGLALRSRRRSGRRRQFPRFGRARWAGAREMAFRTSSGQVDHLRCREPHYSRTRKRFVSRSAEHRGDIVTATCLSRPGRNHPANNEETERPGQSMANSFRCRRHHFGWKRQGIIESESPSDNSPRIDRMQWIILILGITTFLRPRTALHTSEFYLVTCTPCFNSVLYENRNHYLFLSCVICNPELVVAWLLLATG
jgi:hypothetical protein